MVWQRSGTVAVQTGSTTVVGTNVDFAASSRNGDSFVGPDGLTYEVANVASSTVISILPAYKGPTLSGATYAIMPVQGYDKMLSDAFNNLNNQFGPKLAALGTTGNYDTLPIAKGGTAATTSAQACANIGAVRNNASNSTVGMSFRSGAPPGISAIDSSGNNGNTALTVSNGANNAASAVITLYRDGLFGCHFGIDNDNQLKVGGWSFGPVAHVITHAGNATLDPASGGLMSYSVISGFKIYKWANGLMDVISTPIGTVDLAANTWSVVQVALPVSFIDAYSAAQCSIVPVTTHDSYGVISCSTNGSSGVQAVIRNGATIQKFSIVVVVRGRWKA